MLTRGWGVGGTRPRNPHIYVLPTFRLWLRTHLAPHWGGFKIPLPAELWDHPSQHSAGARRVGGGKARGRTGRG